MTAKKPDLDPDPKSLKNPINQQNEETMDPQAYNPAQRGDRPKAITDDEIRFMNTKDPQNPKNRPQVVDTEKGGYKMPERKYGMEGTEEPNE